jgi:GNAT superfamily N-acetyltransferase
MRTAICPTHLHFHDIASHFLALTAGDRYLRFGWVMSDVDIVAYVETLLRPVGNVFVVVEPSPDISGVLHLEFRDSGANFGLSVSAWARRKGIGTLLLERAALLAGARNVRTLFARNLNHNPALRRLALRAGMQVACASSVHSTQREVPTGDGSFAHRGPLEPTITLADHSLRSQWGVVPLLGSQADCFREPIHS